MPPRLVHSTKLQALSPPAQFDAIADAYLDSALRLCRTLARSTRSATYERGMVVMFLAHHSLELFLKGAIVRKSPNESFNHDLEHLSNRYDALYPAKRLKFAIPFSVSTSRVRPEEIRLAQKFIRSRTERLRYPVDKDGKAWGGAHAFEATSFLKSLTDLHDSYARIRVEIDG